MRNKGYAELVFSNSPSFYQRIKYRKEDFMKIGKVKWFGTYNSYYGKFNDYGFLQQFDGEDIYLHVTGIEKDSNFLQLNRNGTYVVYEVTEGKKKNKSMAVNVKLLQEVEEEELIILSKEYKENEEVQEFLRRYCSKLFEKEEVIFFIPYLKEITMHKLFEKKCLESNLEELREKLGEYLKNEQIKRLLMEKRPEVYCQEDMKVYFSEMYSNQLVQDLFWERYFQGYFQTTILRELGLWIQETINFRYGMQSTVDMLLNKIDLEKEKEEDLLFFIKQAKKKYICVKSIFSVRTDLIFLDKEICKVLAQEDIQLIPFGQIVKNNSQVEFLMNYLRPNLQKDVCNQLSQEFIISSRSILEKISEKRLCEIIETIQWKHTEEAYINKWKNVISFIEADVQENAAMRIAISMKEQGMLWDLKWWKIFTDSIKVRILIYASNFKEERKNWVKSLGQIHQFEQEHNNQLLIIMLRYFLNIYLSRDISDKKQNNFEQAHNALMQYITDCFTKAIDINHGLNSLLEKCQCGYGNKIYFCDARIWEREGKIFCPEGYERPGFLRENGKSGRTECIFYKDMNLYETKYQRTKDYKDQFFKDFLINIGFKPDLSFLKIEQSMEYVHRISAFVNRLIDIRPHMKCQTCGKSFYPDFRYAKLKTAKLAVNRYYCLEIQDGNNNSEHDSNIYLNFCYRCESIIDSRECNYREFGNFGQYLCMRCGGTETIEPGTHCPKCGNTDQSLLKLKGHDRIICKKCGYDAVDFVSKFETLSYKENNDSQFLDKITGMIIPEGIEEVPF